MCVPNFKNKYIPVQYYIRILRDLILILQGQKNITLNNVKEESRYFHQLQSVISSERYARRSINI
jgi:hypothetical protein